jgi:hypothetical protein
MAKSFDILRADLNKRLDALPDGEGDRIRERTREQIEAETAYAASLAELGTFPNPWIRLHLGCSQRAAIVTSADGSDDSSHVPPWLTGKLPAKRKSFRTTGGARVV